MTRAVRPGSIQAAVRAALRAAGGIECASDDLGISMTTLSFGTEQRDDRPGGLGVNHLDRLGRIEAATAVPVAQHFAQLAGGVFQPVDLAGAEGADIARLTAEFSDVLRAHSQAHGPGSADPAGYTAREAAAQLVEIDELVQAALVLRAALSAKAGAALAAKAGAA